MILEELDSEKPLNVSLPDAVNLKISPTASVVKEVRKSQVERLASGGLIN